MGLKWRALGKQKWRLRPVFMLSSPAVQKDLWHSWAHPNGVETAGALDLGGASTQISFAVGEKVELNTSDIIKVSLYGYVYTLYTRSFQCYGRNEAEKRFLATLLQVPESDGGEQVCPGGGRGCLAFWHPSFQLQLEGE